MQNDISTLVNKIMADNKAKYAGWTMELPTDGEGNIVVTEAAVEPTTPPSQKPQDGDEVFTKADVLAAVEKARQQEKDKLYGKVTQVEQKLQELTAAKTAEEEAKAAAELAAAQEAKRAAEAEMDARTLLEQKEREWEERLNQTQSTFEQRLAEFERQKEEERAILEKERQFASLQAYTQSRLAQETDNIAPQFLDYIHGNSEQEIDAAIEVAKAKSAEIAQHVQSIAQQAPAPRGASVTGYAPVGPIEVEGGTRKFSPDDIKNMSMSEYAKYRNSFGTARNNTGGLFG
jgi:hypothetical protein